MKNLSNLPALANYWPTFQTLSGVKERQLELPIKDRWGGDVPPGIAQGEYSARDLPIEQYLEILYQVRCDYFHAERSVLGHEDEKVVLFVSIPTYLLAKFLTDERTLEKYASNPASPH